MSEGAQWAFDLGVQLAETRATEIGQALGIPEELVLSILRTCNGRFSLAERSYEAMRNGPSQFVPDAPDITDDRLERRWTFLILLESLVWVSPETLDPEISPDRISRVRDVVQGRLGLLAVWDAEKARDFYRHYSGTFSWETAGVARIRVEWVWAVDRFHHGFQRGPRWIEAEQKSLAENSGRHRLPLEEAILVAAAVAIPDVELRLLGDVDPFEGRATMLRAALFGDHYR